MNEPKKKKKKEKDTDISDELGGGGEKESPPLTREGFFKILYKVIKPMKSEDNKNDANN